MSGVFYKFTLTPIFKKLDAFIPALSLLRSSLLCVLFNCVIQYTQQRFKCIPTPVCFFLLHYIYSKYMFFWVTCFASFPWRQFSKSWTPSFLPYPCSEPSFTFFIFCRHPPSKKQKVKDVYQPLCVSFYYIILLVTTCTSLKIIFSSHKNRP